MAQFQPIQVRYNPSRTYPGTQQNNYVGAQTTAGQRGTLPTFTDANSYSIGNANTYSIYTDASPLLANLIQVGSPTPNIVAGTAGVNGFSDTNYFKTSDTLNAKFSGLTTFTVEGWLYTTDTSSSSKAILQNFDGSNTELNIHINNDSLGASLSCVLNNGAFTVSSPTDSIPLATWTYFAVVYTSGLSSGVKIYLGASPGSATLAVSSTYAFTFGSIVSGTLGRGTSTGVSLANTYLSGLVVSDMARSAFPTLPKAAGVIGAYALLQGGSDSNPGTKAAPFATLGHLFSTNSNALADSSGANGASVNPLTQPSGAVPNYQWPYVNVGSNSAGAFSVIPPTGDQPSGPMGRFELPGLPGRRHLGPERRHGFHG